jgi:hypothetical protein
VAWPALVTVASIVVPEGFVFACDALATSAVIAKTLTIANALKPWRARALSLCLSCP